MRFCEMAFSSVVRTCSWLISSENVCGRYLRAMTWYMRAGISDEYARPRVIRGTRVKPLPLLPSGPGGVCSRPLHEARSLTTSYATSFKCVAPARTGRAGSKPNADIAPPVRAGGRSCRFKYSCEFGQVRRVQRPQHDQDLAPVA